MPEPIKANAAINRKKRKMIVDSTRSQKQAASLPSHPLSDESCLENTFSAVTDLSNGAAYARPEHIDVSILLLIYVHLQERYLSCSVLYNLRIFTLVSNFLRIVVLSLHVPRRLSQHHLQSTNQLL